MAKDKNKKQAKRQIRQTIRQAARNNKGRKSVIKARELKGINQTARKAGVSSKYVSRQGLKISERLGAKIARGAGKRLGTIKPDSGGGGRDGRGGRGRKGNRFSDTNELPYNVLESAKKLDNKAYKKMFPRLQEKTRQYKELYAGETKESKKYLKGLREQVTQRMKINPESYGRKAEGTKFKKLSLAEKYDKNSKRLFKQLERPLTRRLKQSAEGKSKKFHNFNKKGKLKFGRKRFKKYSDSGVLGDAVRDKAISLGAPMPPAKTNWRANSSLKKIGGAKGNTSQNLRAQFAQNLSFV
jgi:hypothetical protein|tara:strand:+ start:42 stop:935 length:894 start_codon:yes stop_codon:yes gene_type:complete